MFTGIVETIGTVKKVEKHDHTESGGNGFSIVIGDAGPVLEDCHLGDSISVSGVCLTVTEFDSDSFKVGIAPETLKRTYLGSLVEGDKVNLERAVSGNTRLGGHIVQGHVDTIAEIIEVFHDENSITLTMKPREHDIMDYLVVKGFIAVDGTSLTLTHVDDDYKTFSVMLIAYTRKKVVQGSKAAGDVVNIEVDLTGKLIAKQVNSHINRVLKQKGLIE